MVHQEDTSDDELNIKMHGKRNSLCFMQSTQNRQEKQG